MADLDNDGDLDLVVCNNDGPPCLLRNDGGNRNRSICFRLIGKRSNRDGIGARVTIHTRLRMQVQELRCGDSYLSASDLRVHFGIGQVDRVERAEVRWPGGAVERFEDLPANHLIVLEEEKGITLKRPMSAAR